LFQTTETRKVGQNMLKGYARASMEKQAIERQLDELAAVGVAAAHIYQEKMTGTQRDRPELNRMLAELNESDTVIVVELSRISRSTKDLLEIVELIHSKGADFKSLNETWLDTTTPHGKLLLTIFAGLSQFERDLIAERTKSGLAAAKARGRNGGRPATEPGKILALHHNGVSAAEIVNLTGVSRSTVYRLLAAARATTPSGV
jgi:DNA invertase Pin-like site-specific DNA recombinase